MTLPAAVSLRRVNHVIYPFLTSTHPSTSLVRPVRTDRPVIQRSVHNQRSFELMQRPIYTYLVSEVRKHTSFPGVFQPALWLRNFVIPLSFLLHTRRTLTSSLLP